MTIDEAIEHAKEVAENRDDMCAECRAEHKQLADWLEELKTYKTWDKFMHYKEEVAYAKGFNDGCAKFSVGQDYEAGYSKAIDDCKSIVLQTLENGYLIDTLWLRMEQLKAGASNE